MLRDMADNGTWLWVGGEACQISDSVWLKQAEKTLDNLAKECTVSFANVE